RRLESVGWTSSRSLSMLPHRSTTVALRLSPASELLPDRLVPVGVLVVVGEAQARGGGLVDDDRHALVQLDRRRRKRGTHRALEGAGHRLRLALAEGEHHEMTGPQDRAEALRDAVHGHVVQRGEEARVVAAGLLGEGFHARAGGEGRARLVEADVATG